VETIYRVEELKKLFPVKRRGIFERTRRYIHAVDEVSFNINKGETFGIVGESGCGKTTLARMLLRLEEPTSGKIFFKGQDITSVDRQELKNLRKKMQMIFQDPYSSLDPRKTIYNLVAEPLKVHKVVQDITREEKVKETLALVDLPITEDFLGKVPDELSGGQRQRIGIARALALNPQFVVCDEAVSALDVSIQAQILNLLKDLQQEYHLAYLFISHDLNVVEYLASRIAVMYLGKLAEVAATQELFANPQHPYTQALLSANPIPDPTVQRERILLSGDVPSPLNPPAGCRFHTRCPQVMDMCKTAEPPLIQIGPPEDGHQVWCHLYS